MDITKIISLNKLDYFKSKLTSSIMEEVNKTCLTLSDLTWGNITEKPSTLAGYNITDAKIEGNTITLGNKSITPIMEHQSLSEYAKTSEVESKISTAKSEIIGGAPATYDTLQEIAQYIEEHKSVETALNAAIGNKADKTQLDNYVKKSGDTMSGAITNNTSQVKFSTTASNWKVDLYHDANNYAFLHYPSAGESARTIAIGIKPDGSTFSDNDFRAKTLKSVVATGTAPLSIASTTVCANLNADMVDGLHSNNIVVCSNQSNTAVNYLTNSGIYRLGNSDDVPDAQKYGNILVLHGLGDTIAQMYFPYTGTAPYVRSGNPASIGGKGSWTNWKQLAFTDSTVANAEKVGGLTINNIVRVGRIIDIDSTVTPSGIYTCSNDETTGTMPQNEEAQGASIINLFWDKYAGNQIFLPYDKNKVYVRNNPNGTWKSWKELAFTDSTVAAANKLATPRTLWGQSFDGSGNVSGDLTGVGNITAEKGFISGGSETGAFFGSSASGLGGSYTGGLMFAYKYNPLYFYTNNQCRMYIDGNGKVGIGTTTPTDKLDVNGNIKTSGHLISTPTTTTDISKVPTTSQLAVVNTSTSGTFGLASLMQAGTELQVFINNTGSGTITIAIPTTFKSNGTDSISIDSGKYGEINIISDGTNMYLRAV